MYGKRIEREREREREKERGELGTLAMVAIGGGSQSWLGCAQTTPRTDE